MNSNREPRATGFGVCHLTALMLTYHCVALSGSQAYAATTGAGDWTLRAAIQEANASPIRADITVQPATYALSLTGTDDAGAVGDLDVAPVSGLVSIHAPQPGATVVGPTTGESAVFEVHSGAVGMTGIGVRGALHLLDVRGGATLNLAAT